MTKNNKLGLIKKLNNIALISSFLGLIKKNLKLILRSKSSSTIIFLGPLFIIFLVGASFNTSSLYNIKIGTYSSSYSELANNLLNELGDKQFQIVKQNSQDNCLVGLKNNDIHVCAVFPPNLKIGGEDNVEFFVDNSKINLVWVVIDTLSTKVSTKSSELSQHLANNLLNTLIKTENTLNQKKSTINTIGKTNNDIEIQFTTISSSLNNLDLSFNVGKIGIDKISGKLDEVINDNNLNKSLFQSVDESIRNAIDSTEDLEKKFNQTNEIKDNLIVYLNDATKLITNNKDGVNDIKNTINILSTDINNVKSTSAETIATPIKIAINPISVKSTHLNFLFPTLVMLIIMFIGLLLSSILVVREKLSNAYFRNFITPTSDILFILSDYVTNLIIIFMQLIIIFSVGFYFFGQGLLDVLFNSLIIVFLLSTLFIFLGMFMGYLFRTEETVILATFSLGSLFLFFSGTILPLEVLPESIKNIADFNPFVLGESVLKKIMLFNFGLEQLSYSLYIILAYIFLLSVGIYLSRKLSKRNF